MCRNLFIIGVKEDKQKHLIDFMDAAYPFLTQNNDDGVGYAAITKEGIYGERWVNVNEFLRNRNLHLASEGHRHLSGFFKDKLAVVQGSDRYSLFAEKTTATKSPMMSVIMHARAATNKVCIENTHPFYREGVAMTHNGVIANDNELTKLYSTCDSEVILNSYVENKVNKDPDNIKNVSNDLRGGYACGILSHNENNRPIIDIFRNYPMLYATYVAQLEALVICTSLDVIDKTLEELKWDRCESLTISSEKMIRLDAETGEFISKHAFENKTYSSGNNGSGGQRYYPGSYGGHHHTNDDLDDVVYLNRYKSMKGTSEGKKQELEHIKQYCSTNQV